MKFFLPDKSAQYALTLAALLISEILAVLSWNFIPYHNLMVFSCLLFIFLGIFFSAVYLPFWFAHLQYNFTESYITMRCGAFMITEQTVKFSSVQYTGILKCPFFSSTGLNLIVLNVFGGRMILFFLKEKDLQELLFYINGHNSE